MLSLAAQRNRYLCHICRVRFSSQLSAFNNAWKFSKTALKYRDGSLQQSDLNSSDHTTNSLKNDECFGYSKSRGIRLEPTSNIPIIQKASWNSHTSAHDKSDGNNLLLDSEIAGLQNPDTAFAISRLLGTFSGVSEVQWSPPTVKKMELVGHSARVSDVGVQTIKIRWNSTGLRPVVIETIQRAFPNASHATRVQRQLISALSKGYSVIVNDLPTTGKSFAIAMWLMSLERSQTSTRPSTLSTTALVLAPNMDLVKQYQTYILELLNATGSKVITENSASFVQALYRLKSEDEEQLKILQKNPRPHIIIATPTKLLDLLSHEDPNIRNIIDYDNLRAIVLEESDVATERFDQIKESEGLVADNVKDPLILLLDYVFKFRQAAAAQSNKRPTQPQLVIPTSVTGHQKTKNRIIKNHSLWLDGDNRPGFTSFTGKGTKSLASTIMTIRSIVDAGILFPRRVSKYSTHHIVAYNPITGSLRDAPLPTYISESQVERAILKSDHFEELLQEKLAAAIDDAKDEDTLDTLINSYQHIAPETIRAGYPTPFAVNVVEKLLEHDRYPSNVIVNLGETSSQPAFIAECIARGINARYLQAQEWNTKDQGRHFIGRRDHLVGSSYKDISCEGHKDSTTVWVSNYYQCRGVDYPGIYHSYILHRLEKVREYITYCGRVGNWPFPTGEVLRDPKVYGQDQTPTAKVVSVLLEQSEYIPLEQVRPYSIIQVDGSENERWAWTKEALRMAKIGVKVDKYFK